MAAQQLAQHLLTRGLVAARIIDRALRQAESLRIGLDTALLLERAIAEVGLLQAISDVAKTRQVNLADFEPNYEAGPLMPYKMSKQLGVVPLSLDGQTLHLASCFPIQNAKLKDVGALLGRRLETWVAIEVRVRAWQSIIYGQPLDEPYDRVFAALDPTRNAATKAALSQTDNIALEVVERSLSGLNEEPLLLTSPKRKKKRKQLEILDHSDSFDAVSGGSTQSEPDDEHHTTVLDPTAYGTFARGEGLSTLGDRDETRVLDISGYANFARRLSDSAEGLVFPGGVLPPKPAKPIPPPPKMPSVAPTWVQPAPATRAAPERVTGSTPVPSAPRLSSASPPPVPAFHPKAQAPAVSGNGPPRDESDFSDVEQLLRAPSPTPPLAAAARSESTEPTPSRPAPSFLGATRASAPRLVPLVEPYSSLTALTPPPPLPNVPPQEMWTVPPPGATPAWNGVVVPSRPLAPTLSPPPGLAPAVGNDWTLQHARAELKACVHDRDALLNVALEYGRRTFEFVAAFAIVRGVAAGWDVRGELDRATVRKLAIPLDAASVFRTVALTRGSYVGPLPNDALTQHYLALLGRSPRTVFVWPIEVQSRLIAMLYGDCGSRPVSQRRLADFILFCQDLPSAFHDLIVFRRQTALVANTFDVEPQATAATPAAATTDAPADSEWYNGLLALLTGPDPAERSMAMLELMKTPAASAAALAKAFPGPTGWSRLPVVELPEPDELGPIPGALARLGEDGANALEPLLDSSDSDTRYLALLTSGSLPFANLVDGVMRGLFDFDPDVSSAARAAARALALIPNFQSALKDLRAELSSTDAIRRSLAARALGVLHDRAALPNLIELTGNEDELVATSAAEALKETTKVNWGPHPDAWRAWFAHAGERRRVEWLVSALSSDDADLRLSAIEELSKVFGDNHGFLADGPPPERLRAVERWESEIAARPDLDI